MKLDIISRERAESAVPPDDCSGRQFTPDEREDLFGLSFMELKYKGILILTS